MTTVNDLAQYKICPVIPKYADHNLHFRWNTFEVDLEGIKSDINKVIASMTFTYLCQLLENSKTEFLAKESHQRLSHYEAKYNKVLWSIFESTSENVKVAANGWVRLIEIYRKIISIANEYKFIADNIEISTRVFKEHPVMVKTTVPALLLGNKCFDALFILPERSRRPINKFLDVYHMLVSDYLVENRIHVDQIHEISFNEFSVTKSFNYSKYHLPDLTRYSKAFLDLSNGREMPNIMFCNNCKYSNKCSHHDLTSKPLLK